MLLIVALASRRVALAVPVRQVKAGMAVASGDGVVGVVVRQVESLVLVQVEGGARLWMHREQLVEHRGAAPQVGELGVGTAEAALPTGALKPHGAFARLGERMFDRRRLACGVAAAIVVACLPLAGTLDKSLSGGGFTPKGESMDVQGELRHSFNVPLSTVTLIVPRPAGTTLLAMRPQLAKFRADAKQVEGVRTTLPPIPSRDGKYVQVTVLFSIGVDHARDHVDEVEAAATAAGIKHAQLAGEPVIFRDISFETKDDLAKAERIGMPVALIVLAFVFGTLVAAILPMLIGLASVVITLGLLHLVAMHFELSIYVMNIASLLGLGLGIDYSLLGVVRFRAELDNGASVRDAVAGTVATAGKATVVSGIGVITGVSALALFPLPVLHSIAIAGVIVVTVSVLLAITLLPAMLAILGHRIERLAIRKRTPANGSPLGNGDGAPAAAVGAGHASGAVPNPAAQSAGRNRWQRLAWMVMRNPVPILALGTTMILLLALPTRGAHLDVPGSSVLPSSAPSRQGEHLLARHFAAAVLSPVWITVRTGNTAAIDAYVTKVKAVDNVESATAFVRLPKRTLIRVVPAKGKQGGPDARHLVERLRALPPPVDPTTHYSALTRVGGQGADQLAFLSTISQRALLAVAYVGIATFLVLLIAFRSVLLPIKAILLDALSIAGSLGVVIAIFQNGHFASVIGADPLGFTEATMPVILIAVLFGLSMDYEVFMLSAIAERYQRGESNDEATAEGLAQTAPLVTGAALILIVIGISFASTQLVLVKEIGLGIAVSLLIDSTIVRCLLVPATMRLLGDRNWWCPDWLARRLPVTSWAH